MAQMHVPLFILQVWNIGKWSETSLNVIPFVPDTSFSTLFVNMLSVKVAVCWVILVGFQISGEYDDCSVLAYGRYLKGKNL